MLLRPPKQQPLDALSLPGQSSSKHLEALPISQTSQALFVQIEWQSVAIVGDAVPEDETPRSLTPCTIRANQPYPANAGAGAPPRRRAPLEPSS
jgi:hypothetical protein